MMPQDHRIGLRIHLSGRVQGVGFRPWACNLARDLGLTGRVWNDADGVTLEAFGTPEQLQRLRGLLATPALPAARVAHLAAVEIPYTGHADFEIAPSRSGGAPRVSIPPDAALCRDCRRELNDPCNRRYRYPFINCTQCGPRYTICEESPYDRHRTTMREFEMCEDCRSEYHDRGNRRYHAEPIACPACGPQLQLLDHAGRRMHGDPIRTAGARLRAGEIVAVKGLGGFHLACDARSTDAVQRLRDRKRREEKPLAVMVPNLAAAERFVYMDSASRAALCEPARPIVLLAKRATSDVAEAVAPRAVLLGLMLPYTPLHELLLAEFAGPLVMTSGNLSDLPILLDNAAALHRLRGIADAFLLHDRDIANRCDDSVVRIIAGQATVLRRARGHVPAAIELPGCFSRPILACGAHLKNTFCLAYRGNAWLGPHIGDLESDESCEAFEVAVRRSVRLAGAAPEIVAHDLHPDYFTTRYAADQPLDRRVGIQHHHAHIAAVCAEHGYLGPVIGLAWDGTGFGTDGTAWGGELLVGELRALRRVATLRPIRLAGGDTAIREVWRIALAVLEDAFDGAPPLERLELFRHITAKHLAIVREMLTKHVNVPAARGAGRYFDAAGALLLARPEASYEGQVAIECEFLAHIGEHPPYEFDVIRGEICEFDLRPTFRALTLDLMRGVSRGAIAARFHVTMAEVARAMVELGVDRAGRLPVGLSGGCFQNARLMHEVLRRIPGAQRVLRHGATPPNDGGIALGQALLADLYMGTI